MNYPIDEIISAVLSIFPDAEVNHDNDGQIIIYTGLDLEADDVAGGNFKSPIKPVTDDAVRLVVLNDGETFTDAGGVTIVDWYGENEITDIEDGLRSFNEADEDPNMKVVAYFGDDGGLVL